MTIYYRRITTYKKWPENDVIDTDEVHFSKSKNRFEEQVFLKLPPSADWGSMQKQARHTANVKNANFQKV